MATEKRLISLDEALGATHEEVFWTESEAAAVRSFLLKRPKVDAVEADKYNIKLHHILIDNEGVPEVKLQIGDRYFILHTDPVDVREVVHGRWEDVFKGNCAWERYKCSVCGGYALYRHEQVFEEWKTVQVLANYCPYCGAYMENGEENGEM